MTWKKRIISIALCLCALLCADSVRAEAADHSHPICGGTTGTTCTHAGDKHTSNVPWTAWDGTTTINNDFFGNSTEKYLYLSQDVTPGVCITVPEGKTLYLCLNGHSLKSKDYYAISVSGTLVLCDCNSSGQGKGVISHGKKDNGSLYGADGIYVVDNAIFTMYGGTISNNDGSGVLVSGGTFTMYGGEISHNTRTETSSSNSSGGGGVCVKKYWVGGQDIGKFYMYGGKICNNTYKGPNLGGGGVYASGTGDFIIQGGTITDNQCSYNGTNTSNGAFGGGGLHIPGQHNSLEISNNTVISNNTCEGHGGGIFVIGGEGGSITNCTISGNSATGTNATGTNGMGGGLAFQNSTFTLEKCTITDNKTTGKGGAICLMTSGANLTLSSGLIFSGNQDNYPADKSGNLTTGTANDVFLHTGAYLRLASDFSKTSTAPIVVTTYFTPSDNSYQKIAVDNRTTPDPTDFKYGTDSTIGIIAKTNNGKVELLACKHSYSTQKDETNHWQECSICKDIKGVTAHSGGEASCTKKAVCRVCNQPYGKLAAHVYDMTTWVKIDNDHHGHKCKNCNAIDESTKAPHTWDEGKVTTPATCTTPGEKTYTCAVCSATKTEVIHASGHDLVHHEAKAATCTAVGWDAYDTCRRCDYTTYVEEAASGHDLVHHEAKAATCTAVGWDAYDTCSRCDYTTYVEKAASGHDLVHHEAKAATCTAIGWDAYDTCSRCDYTTYVEKSASGHDLVHHEAKAATCTAIGWDAYDTCTRCDYTTYVEKSASGHDLVHHEAKAATCTAIGWDAYDTCTRCDYTTYVEKSASGHDLVHHEAKAATCTAIGWDAYDTCTRCDYTTYVEKAASGHDLVHHEAKAATCTAVGWDAYDACRRCDYTTYVEEAASGHDLVHHEAKAATCTAVGWDAYDTCTRCDYTTYVEKAALGHDFTVPKYDEIQHWYKCANCTATTEPAAHTDFTAWKSDRSGHWHECSTCGYKTAVNAHTPDRDKATETTPQLCTECGYVIAPATHPVHTWVFVAETPATCNAAGEREHYKCTCGRTSFKNGDAYKINEDASVLTIEKNSANHTGAPDSKWHSDSANHWQDYTCCHARANEAAHSGGAATCTAQAVCEVCGKAYGPLAAHAWGAWKVTTPATKDALGVETRTCAHNSAHTETRSIPKLSTAVYTVSEDTKIAQIEAKVDGLDKILELNENKALVNDGKSVGVSLTVKNTASSGVSEKIKEKLAGSNLVGLRLELTVEKTVTANGVVEWKQTIPDAGVLLKTTITLPAELRGKSGYVVYRLHDGNVHVLTETANENGEFISVSADKTQITICARLYSEYVIAYQTGGSSGGGYHPVKAYPS